MKSFIISTLIFLIPMGMWIGFDVYSDRELNRYICSIENEIIPYIEEENLQAAEEALNSLKSDWHEYRKYAEFFFGTNELNEIDYAMEKSESCIENGSASDAAAELAYLKTQLRFIDLNEGISAGNVF